MPKRISARIEKRVVVVHHNARARHLLADAWRKISWSVFEAEGRDDGLPLIFQLRPTLINLEVIAGQNDGWNLVSSIRLFTDVPVAILLYRSIDLCDQTSQNTWVPSPNELVLNEPLAVNLTISKVQAFWKNAWKRGKLKRSNYRSSNRVSGLAERSDRGK